MATSPSDPHQPDIPPEVIAIAVALAATMFEPAPDEASAPSLVNSSWRWEGWD